MHNNLTKADLIANVSNSIGLCTLKRKIKEIKDEIRNDSERVMMIMG